jgi:hypothetical protein
MSRRLGEYVPLSTTYADDDAILQSTPMAELLFVRALALAGQLKSDGYLTEAQVKQRAARGLGSAQKITKLVDELVERGLWIAADGGYVIRTWLKWNKSAQDLGHERARDRDRKRAERSTQDSLWESSDQQESDSVHPDTDRTPDGLPPESGESPDLNPDGVPADSASRGGAHAGHGTIRHGTALNGTALAGPPAETAGQRINRLARVYTDKVRMSNFNAVAGIVRKAVNDNQSDDVITTALLKLVGENRTLTTETLRRAIYGPPNGNASSNRHQAFRNVADQSAYDEEMRPA